MNAEIAETVERCEICSTHRASKQKDGTYAWSWHTWETMAKSWKWSVWVCRVYLSHPGRLLFQLLWNHQAEKYKYTRDSSILAAVCTTWHTWRDDIRYWTTICQCRIPAILCRVSIKTHHTFSKIPTVKGKAEKAAQIAESLLKKSAEEGEDVHLALLAYKKYARRSARQAVIACRDANGQKDQHQATHFEQTTWTTTCVSRAPAGKEEGTARMSKAVLWQGIQRSDNLVSEFSSKMVRCGNQLSSSRKTNHLAHTSSKVKEGVDIVEIDVIFRSDHDVNKA